MITKYSVCLSIHQLNEMIESIKRNVDAAHGYACTEATTGAFIFEHDTAYPTQVNWFGEVD